MKDLHPSRAQLDGYLRDELPSPRRRKISGHVSLCPACQRRLARLEQEADKESGAVDYEAAFLRAADTLRSLKEGIDDEARRSAALLPELLQEPPQRRFERIAADPRFHALKLCQLLQDRSRSDWFGEPARCLESARLAVLIADHLDERRYGSATVAGERARAWALLGNSYRIDRKLKSAEQALRVAAEHQRLAADPLAECEILGFTASLRRIQGRTGDSIVLLDRAVLVSREIGDRLREGRALVLKGTALGDIGRYREALRILCKRRLRIGLEADPELGVIALYNRLTYLADAGRPLEAEQILQSEGHLFQEVGRPRLLARLLLLKGVIARGLGRLDEAKSLLYEARELFNEQQAPLDWAQATLRLAMVLARQGNPAEGRHLLEEAIPVLDLLEIHPEAETAKGIYRVLT